ncbi:hypothetical protein ACERIT_02275 [Halopenitus sp. H-Gu1]|uniref:hypothetical protein n=1 Tax=Halopenitus sp. H-Gu1 TaxID=3242697 RepID=UPI00359E1E67
MSRRIGTAESRDSAPDRTAVSAHERSRCEETGNSHQISRTRVRVVTLEAEVELLEAERETLVDLVTALESDLEELENEVASLERTIEYKEQQRQQVIDKYEHIIAEKDQAYQELRQELAAATTGTSIWPLPVIKPLRETVLSR